MTGVFILKVNKKPVKAVELPEEVFQDLIQWWWRAKSGDKIEVYCDLET